MGYLPQQVPIESYGDGGFRFSGMSHQGSILCLPDGMFSWDVSTSDDLQLHDFNLLRENSHKIDIFLLGTGQTHRFPHPEMMELIQSLPISYEILSTGSAVRTYNILLSEDRRVGCGLIAM
jgi:uncharacterized protein